MTSSRPSFHHKIPLALKWPPLHLRTSNQQVPPTEHSDGPNTHQPPPYTVKSSSSEVENPPIPTLENSTMKNSTPQEMLY